MTGMPVYDLLPRLPEPFVLQARCRSFAVLDAVFTADYRTHTYTERWAPDGTALAGMTTGTGDLYAIAFGPAGTFLYGFDHESPVTPWREDPRQHWPGLLDGVPASLAHLTREPAFLCEDFFDATVCAWNVGAGWRCGPVDFTGPLREGELDPDGAGHLFDLIVDGSASAYAEFVKDYFEVDTDEDAVAAVLAGRPLSAAIVTALYPAADFPTVAAEATGMRYPVAR